MALEIRAKSVGGLLYLLPIGGVAFAWIELVFMTKSDTTFDFSSARKLLTDGFPSISLSASWFRWFLFGFPLLCLALCLAYMSKIAAACIGALTLAANASGPAVAAWFTTSHTMSLLVALAIPFGLYAVRSAFKPR